MTFPLVMVKPLMVTVAPYLISKMRKCGVTSAVVRCILRVKTPARLILTCDASPLAGLPPGPYREWDQAFEVLPSGKIIHRVSQVYRAIK